MLLAVILAALPARADIPPRPDYVERCTVAEQCGAGKEGTTCSASFEGRADCEKLEQDGWTRACKTRGASVWTEVLCRPAGGAANGGAAPALGSAAPSEGGAIPEVAASTTAAPAPTTAAAPAPAGDAPAAESSRCGTPGPVGIVGLAGALALAMRRRTAR